MSDDTTESKTKEEKLAAIKARMKTNRAPKPPSMAKTKEELHDMLCEIIERAWKQLQAVPLHELNRRYNQACKRFGYTSMAECIDELCYKEILHTFMQGSSKTFVVPYQGYIDFMLEAEGSDADIANLHSQLTIQTPFRNL